MFKKLLTFFLTILLTISCNGISGKKVQKLLSKYGLEHFQENTGIMRYLKSSYKKSSVKVAIRSALRDYSEYLGNHPAKNILLAQAKMSLNRIEEQLLNDPEIDYSWEFFEI